MKENILIIDDDNDIRNMIVNYFQKEGYPVYNASDGEEGLQILKSKSVSLIILDIMMPKMDGYTMLSKLREFSSLPVILLTAKDQQMDKIRGFIAGCDDYIVKPFDFTELSLRVLAILRRSKSDNILQKHMMKIKDIEINTLEHTVKKDNVEIVLTPKEYEILYTLASNKGRVYSTRMLYEIIWKDTFLENDNTVTMHIKNLREKLGDSVKQGKYIKTIWGVGYKIEKNI
ncbi:MAG: response regulator transcription factor [Clostridium sp.]|uniref:response regulator transcription factor n=1 Tax=Clostridium sp. TaxID=1506 RepID=UPI0025C10752|nr:response regulator transcription factor [Clostridium sp.]MCH3965446.1 response regulator transcription factor [Clostridium sp.]MCI1717273.1 response regulator transcription factor [Clostridium sp.]MCI1801613.1 response regulator transcription factor [Clostridium sp.]MCI1815459.1 response regulator transcription factor [Clostridium sp.]MCI1872362.1 response regulator transcription factor [Clostridium sp.]